MKKSAQVRTSGFTLVELLVVIAIIAILAAVVVLIINPLEITRRGRDAARLTDLANLQQAINVVVQEATESGAALFCSGASAPCTDNSNAGTRAIDGSGWVKVNLAAQNNVSVPTLPIDPIVPNTTANHYTYCGSATGWKLVADLESVQQSAKETNDGGVEAQYEVGSEMSLACTY